MARSIRRRAFTLIEILAVVTILAILAAVMFPVFGRVRENGRRTVCASNAKQFALALLQYGQDHDESLVPIHYDSDGDVEWTSMLNSYVKNPQIFRCPSDTKSKDISYGLNQLVFLDLEEHPNAQPVKLSQFQSPSQTIMLGETGTTDDLSTLKPDTSKLLAPSETLNDAEDARPCARHFDEVTLAFVDGHVKPMRLEQFFTGQTPPDKWFKP
jgi:prepilin-type N-terminal cleavage/methylation domain-containing protein